MTFCHDCNQLTSGRCPQHATQTILVGASSSEQPSASRRCVTGAEHDALQARVKELEADISRSAAQRTVSEGLRETLGRKVAELEDGRKPLVDWLQAHDSILMVRAAQRWEDVLKIAALEAAVQVMTSRLNDHVQMQNDVHGLTAGPTADRLSDIENRIECFNSDLIAHEERLHTLEHVATHGVTISTLDEAGNRLHERLAAIETWRKSVESCFLERDKRSEELAAAVALVEGRLCDHAKARLQLDARVAAIEIDMPLLRADLGAGRASRLQLADRIAVLEGSVGCVTTGRDTRLDPIGPGSADLAKPVQAPLNRPAAAQVGAALVCPHGIGECVCRICSPSLEPKHEDCKHTADCRECSDEDAGKSGAPVASDTRRVPLCAACNGLLCEASQDIIYFHGTCAWKKLDDAIARAEKAEADAATFRVRWESMCNKAQDLVERAEKAERELEELKPTTVEIMIKEKLREVLPERDALRAEVERLSKCLRKAEEGGREPRRRTSRHRPPCRS